MSALREEIHSYIDNMSASQLEAIKPILHMLANDTISIETDLTEEERAIIAEGRKDYEAGRYVSLDSLE